MVEITVVVDDVAAAWRVEDVDVVELVLTLVVLVVLVVEVILVLVVDVLPSVAATWVVDAPSCPPSCPYTIAPPLEDEFSPAFEQSVWVPSPLKKSAIKVFG